MMYKRAFAILILCLTAISTYAVDRIVQESGGPGTFASINAAVTAAADGDRIIIVNRAGGLSWTEDVNISKSLTFLDGLRWRLF